MNALPFFLEPTFVGDHHHFKNPDVDSAGSQNIIMILWFAHLYILTPSKCVFQSLTNLYIQYMHLHIQFKDKLTTLCLVILQESVRFVCIITKRYSFLIRYTLFLSPDVINWPCLCSCLLQHVIMLPIWGCKNDTLMSDWKRNKKKYVSELILTLWCGNIILAQLGMVLKCRCATTKQALIKV